MLITVTQNLNYLKKLVKNYAEIIKRHTYVALTDKRLQF